VSLSGVAVLVAIIVAFTMSDRLVPELTPAAAELRIRQYYDWELSRQQLEALRQSGRRLPDPVVARTWDADRVRVAGMKFDGTEVKRPWLDLLSDLPHYLARTTVRTAEGVQARRCFWIDAERFDREVPNWLWYVLY